MSKHAVWQVLDKFGLTAYESMVYVLLSKSPPLGGFEITRALKAHRAQVYRALKSLEKRGLVNVTVEVPARFSAIPFDQMLDMEIKAREQETAMLKNEKDELLSQYAEIEATKPESLETLGVIEGDTKIYAKIFQMIERTRKEFLAVISGSNLVKGVQMQFDAPIFEKALANKIRSRLLTQGQPENLHMLKDKLAWISQNRLEDKLKARYINSGNKLFTRFIVRDEDEALIFLRVNEDLHGGKINNKDACMVTNCGAVVNVLKVFFEELWTNSTEIG